MVREVPLIFPDALVHADMAQMLTRVLRAERPDGRMRQVKPVAAGFLTSTTLAMSGCNGVSESLGGLKSRGKQDDELLSVYDYLHGIKS